MQTHSEKTHHHRLFQYFERHFDLNPADRARLPRLFPLKTARRREFLLQAGEVCRYNHFVLSGALRMYYVNEQGRDFNLQFAFENWWMGDMGSFFNQKPAKLNIQAMEKTHYLRISLCDQIHLCEQDIRFSNLFRKLTERALVRANARIMDHIASDAITRYQDFIDKYPAYLQRIPNKEIASYIGVTPEFFSSLRKKVPKKDSNN